MAENVDGKFEITMQTPMGAQDGFLTFVTDGDNLSGILEILGNENPFSGGKVDGNTLTFSGTFKSVMGETHYDGEGTIDGDDIEGVSHTMLGDFPLTGTRI